jgi:hypothetical protein
VLRRPNVAVPVVSTLRRLRPALTSTALLRAFLFGLTCTRNGGRDAANASFCCFQTNATLVVAGSFKSHKTTQHSLGRGPEHGSAAPGHMPRDMYDGLADRLCEVEIPDAKKRTPRLDCMTLRLTTAKNATVLARDFSSSWSEKETGGRGSHG